MEIEGRPRDEKIYPLSELATLHPDLHQRHNKKYLGREHVPQREIPPLNCCWTDVVFLFPIHPQIMCQTIATCTNRNVPSVSFFEIDTESLPSAYLAVRLFENEKFDLDETVIYNPATMKISDQVPKRTIQYLQLFRNYTSDSERPRWLMYVPHFFYKGSIDVSDLENNSTTPCQP
jgi:hypothetical protein